MSMPDYAKTVKDALAAEWAVSHQTWGAPTLTVPDSFNPDADPPTLLVADDTGPALIGGAWVAPVGPRRPLLRLTAFANGRTLAREVVEAAAAFVVANRPGIARIEDISAPLITRDRETGADLASITVPVIVRKTA
jgi:hypothetical protein